MDFSFSISPSNEYPGLISFKPDWLDLLAGKGLSRVFSNTTVQKHQFLSLSFLYSPTHTSIHDYWKKKKKKTNIALIRQNFIGKVMSLLLNMVSSLGIIFLLRSKHLLISWLQLPSADFGAPKNKVNHYFHYFLISAKK